ncbi:succinate dehydrogenase/fumarate reductase flavoprotein subunit [Fonsecaea pedrosoi]|nr:succinate dehydrogenase/fumarate reductase flavoprotein subunit [Fonsecaea pedrosoi]
MSFVNSLPSTGEVYDVVVVGSGFAGSTTTLRFLEECERLGKSGKIALIEAGKEGERCGASRWTQAVLRLTDDNVFDPNWKHCVSGGLADQAYCEKLEKEAPISVDYLKERGVKLHHHYEENLLVQFSTRQHFCYPVGGGHAIINTLFDHIRKYPNVKVLWETTAEHLLQTEQGEVCGVRVRQADGKLSKVFGKKVMLACGGFEGSKDLMAQFVGPRVEHLPVIAPGLKYNTGFGLKMGMEVGAQVAGSMNGLHCEMVDSRTTKPDAVIWGHNFGIVVNRDCKRFYDEGKDSLFATFEMIALEVWRDQEAYFITDKPIMDRFRPGWVFETTDLEPESSDTIEGLAEKLGINPKALKKTVDEFNAAINDAPLDLLKHDGKSTRGLTPEKSNWAAPIKVAPFYGFPLKANVTFTFGGLKTDLDSRVISITGAPIPNLYCTGELSGVFYNEYPGAVSVLRSLTFGRLAGQKFAQDL